MTRAHSPVEDAIRSRVEEHPDVVWLKVQVVDENYDPLLPGEAGELALPHPQLTFYADMSRQYMERSGVIARDLAEVADRRRPTQQRPSHRGCGKRTASRAVARPEGDEFSKRGWRSRRTEVVTWAKMPLRQRHTFWRSSSFAG